MELNDLIALMAAPLYVEFRKTLLSKEARERAMKEARELWDEVLKQDKEN